ncbi:hypothetical protein Ga0061062_108120 [Comamonas thiooxydans]|nr:hypothetical protein Ga0061062_108120 [Comamonas thiooxydans]
MSRAHDLERDQRSKLRKLSKRDKRAYYLMGAYGYGPDDFAYKFAWVWRTLLPPIGYRWRGKHVVPVDKRGAMVRAKDTR